jgi:hypothetical protein
MGMKAEFIKEEELKKFEPKTITLTFETQKELDTMLAIFDYSSLQGWFNEISENYKFSSTISSSLFKAGAKCCGKESNKLQEVIRIIKPPW